VRGQLPIHVKLFKLKILNKGTELDKQLRRYLNGILQPKDHKEDPSTDGRITSNRAFAK